MLCKICPIYKWSFEKDCGLKDKIETKTELTIKKREKKTYRAVELPNGLSEWLYEDMLSNTPQL